MSDDKDDYLDEIYRNLGWKPGELHRGPMPPPRTEVRHGALVFGRGDGQIFVRLELDKIEPFTVAAQGDWSGFEQPQVIFRGDHLFIVSDSPTLELVAIRVGTVDCLLSPVPARVFANGGQMLSLEMPTCNVGQRIGIRFRNPGVTDAIVKSWLVGRFIR